MLDDLQRLIDLQKLDEQLVALEEESVAEKEREEVAPVEEATPVRWPIGCPQADSRRASRVCSRRQQKGRLPAV